MTTPSHPHQNEISKPELERALRLSLGNKSAILAYILWFFLGGLGAHRFYLGQTKSAVLMLVLSVLGWVTSGIVIGIFLLIIVFLWWLLDAVLIFFAARRHNRRIDEAIRSI